MKLFNDVGRTGARGWRLALDLVLPRQCLACGVVTAAGATGVSGGASGGAYGGEGALCAACWSRVHFISRPYCARCGYPFDLGAVRAAGLCGACARRPPPFERARAVFAYDDASRGLVIGFKHADKTHAGPAFAAWMARAGAELLQDADLIVPVPLHRWRLLARRYNQAALLAQGLARAAGRQAINDLLIRRRATKSQGRLGRLARAHNVRGAFAVNPSRHDALAGCRVLLVDDVFTTGATVEAAVADLLRAGAAAVDVLTLARVVRPL